MHVHDMHLGEETGLTQSPSRSRGRRGQDAARSPPAAAAGQSGDAQRSYASAAAGGAEGAPEANAPPKLAFYLNGRLLEPGTTVFQAVQTAVGSGSSAAQASGSDMSSRLWGTIHTLSYRTYAAAQRLRSSTAGEGSGPMDMETAVVKVSGAAALPGNVAASPLGELLSPCCGTFTDAAGRDRLEGALSTDATDVLAVMCTIEALNRLTPHLLAALDGRRGRPRSASASGPPGHVPREAFISGRLGPKLSQQLKDVISICGGALPVWCGPLVTHARFLFPFEVRRRYLYCSAFGLSRALHFLQQAHSAEHGPGAAADRDAAPFRVNRVHRQKVRISRRRVLESAHRVFELYAGGKSQLEVEFFNEAGSGLGPTLEFYTLLSHEMQKRSLGMWRDEGDAPTDAATKPPQNVQAAQVPAGVVRTISGPGPLQGELHAAVHEGAAEAAAAPDIVNAPLGLFPRPLAPGDARSESGAVPKHFRLLGRVVAKALQDGRLLDLPLSPVFYRLALGHRLDLYDVREVDPALGASLERLYAAEREAAASGGKAVVDGCPVEDLFLTFVLPGDSSYELKPGGSEVPVTSANLAEYINAVVDATLGEGVAVQVEAFCAGVNGIFPISSLTPFFEDEIEAMLCGTGEAWAVGGLAEVIKFDHGYTASSPPVVALLEVLSELDPLDQRRFLRFVTGSPRLPPGGLAALTPRLTVVRKLSAAVAAAAAAGGELGTSLPGGSLASDAAGSFNQGSGPRGGNLSDGDLPSVMTCANYLKLPPYSCKEVLRERLLFAIREGQGSFDLS